MSFDNTMTLGLLAHVDAGKTTLAEALLYNAGAIRKTGRVDHGDSFLDTDTQERERGITIFSKQAVYEYNGLTVTLLDTPGHADFGAETERAIWAMDAAILIISAIDGVQSHTETLWELLRKEQIPTFIFVNKMDIARDSEETLAKEIRTALGDGCFVMGKAEEEELAACDEELLEAYAGSESLSEKQIKGAVMRGNIFPIYFGSALKMMDIEALQEGIADWWSSCCGIGKTAVEAVQNATPSAKIFKISRDEKGERLTHIKVTGGTFNVKDKIQLNEDEEKINQIRIYNGEKYSLAETAGPGTICQLTGLTGTIPGMGIGNQPAYPEARLRPVMNYRVQSNDGTDPHTLMDELKVLEEEEPMLRVVWNEKRGEAAVMLMGEVQLEVVTRLMMDRFGRDVSFADGDILFRETIARKAEGVGHFEPLRHYAEVHLLLEPLERGSGVVLDSICPTDELAVNWQRLIMTHLAEKEFIGTLTGAPITDIKITLAAGRAHDKHTMGGDFREATYRAVRQGLMTAGCILLEPVMDLKLDIPDENVGRAVADLQRMGAEYRIEKSADGKTGIRGTIPARTCAGYAAEVAGYTSGRGRLALAFSGYESCAEADRIIEEIGYDPERDTENTGDSVFCQKGGSVIIPWSKVKEHMHGDSVTDRSVSANLNSIDPKELDAIFKQTYGADSAPGSAAMKRYREPKVNAAEKKPPKPYKGKPQKTGPEYLQIDGYNLIFAWNELKELSVKDVGAARDQLIDILSNYHGYRGGNMILVFDAYKVKGGVGSIERVNGLDVVYTKEAETADMYIEKVTHKIGQKHRVRVVTSDGMEQMIIMGHGAVRTSSRHFIEEIKQAEEEIRESIGG